MPFGKSYLLDIYGISKEKCNDLELVYRYLEELVHRIDMTLFGSIVVIHTPVIFNNNSRAEIYSDKVGVTGFAPLIESSIVIHTLSETGFASIDVYSCKKFNNRDVLDFTRKIFDFKTYEDYSVIRGIKYKCVESQVT